MSDETKIAENVQSLAKLLERMKLILMIELSENDVDAVFIVPDDVPESKVQDFVQKVKGDCDCLENIKNELPEGWLFFDRFDFTEMVTY